MTETKFTPGDWKICKDNKCPCKVVWSIPGDFPVCTAKGFHVAAVHKHMADGPDDIYASIPDEMRNANAALIASAPDLYAALARIVESVARGKSGDVCQTFDFDDARAALAKARGES